MKGPKIGCSFASIVTLSCVTALALFSTSLILKGGKVTSAINELGASSSDAVNNVNNHDDHDHDDDNAVHPTPETNSEETPSISNEQQVAIATATGTPSLESFPNLSVIVVGLEHSGTTITSRLIMNAPCLVGASETGYLLANTPAEIEEIQPWYDWNSARRGPHKFFYMLQDDDLDKMKNATNFAEMYGILRHASHLFNDLDDGGHDCPRPFQMVDKTPRYIYPQYFEGVVSKTPNVPVVVLKKPFERMVESWAKRGDVLGRNFYDNVFDNVDRVKEKYPNRIFILEHDELMEDPDSAMAKVFEFLGLEWRSEYLKMAGLKKKFSQYPDVAAQCAQWEFAAGQHSPDLRESDG